MGQTASFALWLVVVCTTTAATAGGSSCPGPLTTAILPPQCQQLSRVCVDHSVCVLYDNRPSPAANGLPRINGSHTVLNHPPGVDDTWGSSFLHPGPVLRPAAPAASEETRELSHPSFSSCTVPLVIYADHLHSYPDFLINTAARLAMLQLNHTLDTRLTLVVDTFGLKLQPFHRFLLSPLSAFRVTTLSHLSSRMPLSKLERFNPDGQHVRCFRQLLLCQMRGSASSAARALAQSAPIQHPLWTTGQRVFSYYQRRLPPVDPSFTDSMKLKVLIAAPTRSDNVRAVINQDQVWSWCSNFKPREEVQAWAGTACLLHEFGKNSLLEDLVYVRQADVLLGLHDDSLYWAFFMQQHSSVVEIRPRGLAGPQADQHMKEVTAGDGHSIWWWGIDIFDPAHSAPGSLEVQQRGDPRSWPKDRHVFVRLMALQHIFERIALSRGSPVTYSDYRQRQQHHITDLLEPAGDAGSQPDPEQHVAAYAAADAAVAPVGTVPAEVRTNATGAAAASKPRPARALLRWLQTAWGA